MLNRSRCLAVLCAVFVLGAASEFSFAGENEKRVLRRMEKFAQTNVEKLMSDDFEMESDGHFELAAAMIGHRDPTARNLYYGVDMAVVHLKGEVLGKGGKFYSVNGRYLLRVYAFEDEVFIGLINPQQNDWIPLDGDLVSNDPGAAGCSSTSYCGDVTPHPDGTLTRVCCIAVSCDSGFAAFGCLVVSAGTPVN